MLKKRIYALFSLWLMLALSPTARFLVRIQPRLRYQLPNIPIKPLLYRWLVYQLPTRRF